jgi:hypothetical protein
VIDQLLNPRSLVLHTGACRRLVDRRVNRHRKPEPGPSAVGKFNASMCQRQHDSGAVVSCRAPSSRALEERAAALADGQVAAGVRSALNPRRFRRQSQHSCLV